MDYPWSLSAQSRGAITGLSACVRHTHTIDTTHYTHARLIGDTVAVTTSAYNPSTRTDASSTTTAAAIASCAMASGRPSCEEPISIGRDCLSIGSPDICFRACILALSASHIGQSGPTSTREGECATATRRTHDGDTIERCIAAGCEPRGGDNGTPWSHKPGASLDGDGRRIPDTLDAIHNHTRLFTSADTCRHNVALGGLRRVTTIREHSPSSLMSGSLDAAGTHNVRHLTNLRPDTVIVVVATGDAPSDIVPDRRPHAHKSSGDSGTSGAIDPLLRERRQTHEGTSLRMTVRPTARALHVDAVRTLPEPRLDAHVRPMSLCARHVAASLVERHDARDDAYIPTVATRLRLSRWPTSARAPP